VKSNTIRLNKFLASCGLGSRRKCDELISAGRVTINGEIPTIGTPVNPESDLVRLDGRALAQNHISYYILLNKPKGYITSIGDPFGRRTIEEIVDDKYWEAGVFPVGRLDKDTEGLLLLTNDGEVSHRLMHPSFECKKTYQVVLNNPLAEKDKMVIEKGKKLREFHARPCKVTITDEERTALDMTITEGKKRQIRIIFKSLGYKVVKLKRISVGPLTLGRLPRGHLRDLRKNEIKTLKNYLKITT